MAKKNEQNQTNWVFLPVHKTRVLKELGKATLILVDVDRTTILPKVFRRVKETKDFIFYSLPQDFKINIRVSVKNEKTRRYEHTDALYPVVEMVEELGLDKPYKDVETEIEEEVGKSVEPQDDELPF